MNSAEVIRILLFLGVVVFIFVRAIAATYRCVRGRPISWREIAFMALADIGVICVAYGRERAPAVRAAVRAGYVTTLVTTAALAQELI